MRRSVLATPTGVENPRKTFLKVGIQFALHKISTPMARLIQSSRQRSADLAGRYKTYVA